MIRLALLTFVVNEISSASFGLHLDEKCQNQEYRNKNYLMKIVCSKYQIKEPDQITTKTVASSISDTVEAEDYRRGGGSGNREGASSGARRRRRRRNNGNILNLNKWMAVFVGLLLIIIHIQ